MRMMTKLLATTLLGSATFWACGIDHPTDHSREAASRLSFEDGTGSGSDPDPEPDPGGDACVCDPPADGSASAAAACADVSQADLDKAKQKLQTYLGPCKGQAAVDKIMDENDKNKDGKIDRDEIMDFLKKIGLGNGLTRPEWCKGLLKEADKDGSGTLSPDEIKQFLEKIGLGAPAGGGPGTCNAEDNAPVPQ